MKIRSIMLMFGIAAAVVLSLAWTTRPTAPAPTPSPVLATQADIFQVDPVHSSTLFRIRHLGINNFYGRFKTVSGEYQFNPNHPDIAELNITIPADSVDSNNPGRDRHIKSPDFFDVKEFENISFKSTSVKKKSGDVFAVAGDLTFHGVTRSITAEIEWLGEGDKGQRFGYRSGFEARFTIKRTDFGVGKSMPVEMLGDEVLIIVAIEGQKQDPS